MPIAGSYYDCFTSTEIDYIQSNYISESDFEIANFLHKTVESIRLKRQRMGLVKWRLSPLTGKKELIKLPTLKEQEIEALEHFIASNPSSALKEIAYNRLEAIFRSKMI